ncbi:hypothetical protein [Micromonospora sp. KLBMP9576]|uniref:hypothetical protein n=1 Tax=Micromonospora sp. KLBMP9576 TaxID=3424769 RepID=UPI003D94E617
MILPTYPYLPIAAIVPCLLMLLVGLFDDFGPPPPVGKLVPGTVIAVQRDSSGRGVSALLSVDTADGRVTCGIDRAAFPGERVPPLHTQVTVDHTPAACALPPVSQELPRWSILAMGGGGLALMIFWLWAGRRAPRARL